MLESLLPIEKRFSCVSLIFRYLELEHGIPSGIFRTFSFIILTISSAWLSLNSTPLIKTAK